MSTTQSSATARQEHRKTSDTQTANRATESRSNGPRTPKPKVLARFPDLDAKQPVEECVEPLDGLEGRMINQKLARRILVGMACLLVLAAILPLGFRRDGSTQDEDTATTDRPSWQPENPAPEASMAPAWANVATEVGEETSAQSGATSVPAPDGGHETRTQSTSSQEPGADSRQAHDQFIRDETLPASRVRSRPRYDGDVSDNASRTPSDGDYRESVSGADRRYPTVSSTSNRASALPDTQAPVRGYAGDYQAAGSEPPYRQSYRPVETTGQPGVADVNQDYGRPTAPADYREHAPSHQAYRTDSTNTRWRGSDYSRTDAGMDGNQRYVAEPGTDNWSRHNTPPMADYRNPPQAADSRSHQAAHYHSYQARDYRVEPVPDHRPYPAPNYRNTPHAPDYRSAPATDSWSPPAPSAPAQPYRSPPDSQLPPPNSQPGPGYYDGTRTQVTPGHEMPHYQADRRSEPGSGYAPYGSPPEGARLHGTIEQPPVPAQYDSSGSRLY